MLFVFRHQLFNMTAFSLQNCFLCHQLVVGKKKTILIQSTLLVLQSVALNSSIYLLLSSQWVVLVLQIHSQGFSWRQRIDLHQWEATLFHCQVLSYQRNDEPVTEAAANSLCAESYDASH